MIRTMLKTINLLLITLIATPVFVHGDEPDRDALFHIGRNKNANIIQYDAQVNPDGKLYSREPVVGYWVRLAEQGQVRKLTWIQRKFAFGFKLKLNKNENTATLDMAVNLGRTILVKKDSKNYQA